MGSKFEVIAGKHCRKLADRLSVMVYLLGLRCWFADWRIRDAKAEVVSCSAAACCRPCGGTASIPKAATYGAHTYRLKLFKAVNGQTPVLIGTDV